MTGMCCGRDSAQTDRSCSGNPLLLRSEMSRESVSSPIHGLSPSPSLTSPSTSTSTNTIVPHGFESTAHPIFNAWEAPRFERRANDDETTDERPGPDEEAGWHSTAGITAGIVARTATPADEARDDPSAASAPSAESPSPCASPEEEGEHPAASTDSAGAGEDGDGRAASDAGEASVEAPILASPTGSVEEPWHIVESPDDCGGAPS